MVFRCQLDSLNLKKNYYNTTILDHSPFEFVGISPNHWQEQVLTVYPTLQRPSLFFEHVCRNFVISSFRSLKRFFGSRWTIVKEWNRPPDKWKKNMKTKQMKKDDALRDIRSCTTVQLSTARGSEYGKNGDGSQRNIKKSME